VADDDVEHPREIEGRAAHHLQHFRRRGLALRDGEAARLLELTAGWPAALGLAARAVDSGAARGRLDALVELSGRLAAEPAA